jgi:PP4R3-like protein
VGGSTETLIVWTEVGGPEMALSFQEAEGCAAIWYVPLAWQGRAASEDADTGTVALKGIREERPAALPKASKRSRYVSSR